MSGFELSSVAIAATHHIQRYGEGRFRIAHVDFEGSVLVFPDNALVLNARDSNAVTMANLKPLTERASEIEILVFGCGEKFQPPSKTLRTDLKAHGIALEWMDTGAACRTYNVLLSESRQAAAVLIAVP